MNDNKNIKINNKKNKIHVKDKDIITKNNKCIFIFRRDYRLIDNTSLIKCSKQYKEIIPIFIFTYKQIRDNTLKSEICVKFLVESLINLNLSLNKYNSRLRIYYGDEFKIIENLIKTDQDINCISFNSDYTKYAVDRDNKICDIAQKYNLNTIIEDDICLHKLGSVKNVSGGIYSKFTPFYNKCINIDVKLPDKFIVKNLLNKNKSVKGHEEYTASIKSMYDYDKIKNITLLEHGGRNAGIKLLQKIKSGLWNDYNTNRDLLSYKTTHLSPYNKFGCLSIREIYHIVKKYSKDWKNSGLIRQFIWRDFYYNLGYKNPQIFKGAMSDKYNKIKWEKNTKKLNSWKNGETGYPIVDACMKEINTTGYMHNRGRLIVSNFLVRLLHQDWKLGEHYFARNLYDYDPIQNSFGWQVNSAVSGTEARPLTQTILNPWIQSKKYDPKCEYIKYWLPNLKNVKCEHLHKWDLNYENYDLKKINYIKPIIDYKIEKEKNIILYRKYI